MLRRGKTPNHGFLRAIKFPFRWLRTPLIGALYLYLLATENHSDWPTAIWGSQVRGYERVQIYFTKKIFYHILETEKEPLCGKTISELPKSRLPYSNASKSSCFYSKQEFDIENKHCMTEKCESNYR